MEEFLLKYSKLPREFIIDFFKIAKIEYSDNDLVIEFYVICKWLNVRKAHLKRLLVSKFENDYDYKITIEKVKNKNGKGANYVENILLSSDTFKELCMISNTPRAKEVRKYFLEMEKLIKRYHQEINEQMMKTIGILDKNQKPKLNIQGGVIYILESQNTVESVGKFRKKLLFKLGKSTNIDKRMQTYNTGNANKIEPIFILKVNDIDSVENCVKNIVKRYRYTKRKETYEIDLQLLKEAIVSCDEFVNAFKNKIKNNEKKEIKIGIKRMKNKNNKYYMMFDRE